MAYDFDTIATRYDRMNHLMTLGLDRLWRRRAVRQLPTTHYSLPTVLDVACGTGDMTLLLLRRECQVTAVDLSEEMMALARRKTMEYAPRYVRADAEALPFGDASFDAVCCAFGVRNFVGLDRGLGEMLRVLRPGGRMVILELSTPDSRWLLPLYRFYTHRVIPLLGQWLAGSREAYTYLPQSIDRFPKGEAFLDIVRRSTPEALNCTEHRLTFGVCRLYVVNKTKKTRSGREYTDII